MDRYVVDIESQVAISRMQLVNGVERAVWDGDQLRDFGRKS